MAERGVSRFWIALIVIFGVIVIFSLALFFARPKVVPYSDNPKDWIVDKSGGVKVVDVDMVTWGAGYADNVGQQLAVGDVLTVFAYDGWYMNSYFERGFFDVNLNKTVIAIDNTMKPGDGVLEGYIVSKVVGDKLVSDIFVDDDWKKIIGDKTNIAWGVKYQNIRRFVFNEISKGIYKDTVVDDLTRFSSDFRDRSGGIIVGSITSDNINNENFDGVIFIRQY